MACFDLNWRASVFQIGDGPAFGWSTFISVGGPFWMPVWGWARERKGVYEAGLGFKWPWRRVYEARFYITLFIEP